MVFRAATRRSVVACAYLHVCVCVCIFFKGNYLIFDILGCFIEVFFG